MLKGKLNFGFASSSHDPDYIRLEIIDATSRVHFLEVRVDPEQFARAAFGHRGEVDCTFELRRPDLIGTQHENKTELVPWSDIVTRDTITKFKGGRDDEELSPEVRDWLKPFEVDGWRAYVKDVFNYHRYKDKRGVQVSFHRHVAILE
jgi:hypothetical protein